MANPSPAAPTVTIYHNPRCSKSRAALELLREAKRDVLVVDYLVEPPSEAEIAALLEKLDASPSALVRKGEPEYDGFDVDDADLVAQKLAQHPILMERPVVVVGGRALVARPPERVRELLGG